MCKRVYACVCADACVFVCMRVYACVCVCVRVYACVFVFMYAYGCMDAWSAHGLAHAYGRAALGQRACS